LEQAVPFSKTFLVALIATSVAVVLTKVVVVEASLVATVGVPMVVNKVAEVF